MPGRLYVKWGGSLWCTDLSHSPLDVVAWRGNYAPYKYDLTRFSPVGPLLFDQADPSIFTGRQLRRRRLVRRMSIILSEFMGLLYGVYDAKPQGFAPGGFSLHNCMQPHGPDAEAFAGASAADLHPAKLTGTMAFVFETLFPQRVSYCAAHLPELQDDCADCWLGLEKRFTGGTG